MAERVQEESSLRKMGSDGVAAPQNIITKRRMLPSETFENFVNSVVPTSGVADRIPVFAGHLFDMASELAGCLFVEKPLLPRAQGASEAEVFSLEA